MTWSAEHHIEYREHEPPRELALHVDRFWVRALPASIAGLAPVRIMPDGCVDLLFDLERATASVVGAMTHAHYSVPTTAPVRSFAVRLMPGVAHSLLRASASTFTDLRVDLEHCWPDARSLSGRLAEATTPQAAQVILSSRLRRALADAPPADPRVTQAVRKIARGQVSTVSALERDLGLTRQHLARLFREHVGLPPKLFQRILRVQRVLRTVGTDSFAALALDHGYTDQPHLQRDFAALTDSTPKRLARDRQQRVLPLSTLLQNEVPFVQDGPRRANAGSSP